MQRSMNPENPRTPLNPRNLFNLLWTASPPLTVAGLLMLAALVVSVIGLAVDPRIITGAPAWLKPAKFAVSTAIYMLTLAWVLTFLPDWLRTRRVIGWLTAVVLTLEVAIIDAQAWRGVTSHFNVGTTLDGALFSIMGAAIVIQTLSSIAAAIALWRQTFQDRAFGWALSLGMTMTIVGASTGGLMTSPTAAQLEQARATGRIAVVGAHTVGAPDGGPGLPGTQWSVEHGDLRVAHFLGLHALQLLPVVALVLSRRRWADAVRVRLVLTAAASHVSLFAILLWQALRGQALVNPDAATLAALALWATLTAAAVWVVTRRRAAIPGQALVLS
ncbi:MAG TPA: hypothetical protein VI485_11995 [Vicinamibacterales bacterium]|nr:hypothetical protein [Vicinamibacterales bacterium]